jgi:hypothetical protein
VPHASKSICRQWQRQPCKTGQVNTSRGGMLLHARPHGLLKHCHGDRHTILSYTRNAVCIT